MTQSKETALFKQGAIAADIADAGNTAETYITAVDQNGITVHAASNANSNYTRINADGMQVYKGGHEVASFGDGISMYDQNQNEIFSVDVRSGNITHILRYGYESSNGYGGRINLGRSIDTFTSVAVSIYLSDETPDDALTYTYTSLPVLINPSTNPDGEWGFSVEQVNNSTLDIVFYSARNPDEAYEPYIVDNITINYSTNQITSEMDLGAYPDKTTTAPLRIGNGEYNSPSNAFTVDWAGNGLFAGDDIRIGCNPDSSGGTSLVNGEFFNGYYLSQSNAMIVVDVYKVGRLVNLLVTCQRTYAVTVGSNFFTGVVNDGQGLGQVPRPVMEIATGAGFYSQSVIGGFLSIDSNDNLTLTVRNVAGATVNANATVYCTITYVAEE